MSEPLTEEERADILDMWRDPKRFFEIAQLGVTTLPWQQLKRFEATIEARDAEIAKLRKSLEFRNKVIEKLEEQATLDGAEITDLKARMIEIAKLCTVRPISKDALFVALRLIAEQAQPAAEEETQ